MLTLLVSFVLIAAFFGFSCTLTTPNVCTSAFFVDDGTCVVWGRTLENPATCRAYAALYFFVATAWTALTLLAYAPILGLVVYDAPDGSKALGNPCGFYIAVTAYALAYGGLFVIFVAGLTKSTFMYVAGAGMAAGIIVSAIVVERWKNYKS